MSDSELRRIINNKYNIVIDGFGYIETACIQPVINTVRQFDDEKNTRIIEEAINAMQVKHQSELKKAQREVLDKLIIGLNNIREVSESTNENLFWFKKGNNKAVDKALNLITEIGE